MDYQTIKGLKKQTGYILLNYPATRNSDALLTEEVCRLFSDKDGNRYDQLKVHETIGRCRRKYNEKGLFLPTNPQVQKKRKLSVDEMRVAMGYPTTASAGTEHPSWTPPSEQKLI